MFIIKVEIVFLRELDGKLERTQASELNKSAFQVISIYFLFRKVRLILPTAQGCCED